MALIPPGFLDCVVGIGTRLADGGSGYAATGFLFGKVAQWNEQANANEYSLFLVTNRHVLDGQRGVVLRFNTLESAPARECDVDLLFPDGSTQWTAHSNPAVDVAVLRLNPNVMKSEGLHFHFFASDLVGLTKADARASELSEGEGVFVLGFPMGDVGPHRNYVIVRHGILARVRDYLEDRSNVVLIDGTVFPGNSGGPVVVRPEPFAIDGTKPILKAYLLGLVSAYVPYQDVAVSTQTKRPRIIFEENTGLAVVVPYDLLLETVAEAEQKARAAIPTTAA